MRQIAAQAEKAGLSLSSFGRLLLLNHEIPNRIEAEAQRNLLRANADLARLGNLLKAAIGAGGDKTAVERLIRELLSRQREIKAAIARFRPKEEQPTP